MAHGPRWLPAGRHHSPSGCSPLPATSAGPPCLQQRRHGWTAARARRAARSAARAPAARERSVAGRLPLGQAAPRASAGGGWGVGVLLEVTRATAMELIAQARASSSPPIPPTRVSFCGPFLPSISILRGLQTRLSTFFRHILLVSRLLFFVRPACKGNQKPNCTYSLISKTKFKILNLKRRI